MKKIFFIMVLIMSSSLFAQDKISNVLSIIEENNTTLKTLRSDIDAQKIGNKTGIYLADPDVEFDYIWGTLGDNRSSLKVTQTFDIPTISGMKKRLANSKNVLLDLQYKSDRINILVEAKQLCIDFIYYNALEKELKIRLEHARTISAAYKERLEQGDANILEYNKIKLNLSSIEGEISRIDAERKATISELKRLNGGIEITIDDSSYGIELLPNSFDDWFTVVEQKNPVLQYVKEQINVNKRVVKLNKAKWLPKFSAGYAKEFGQSIQTLTVGVSIPLWENKNTVKQAQATVFASEAKQREVKQQFYDQLKSLYLRANGLKQAYINYKEPLTDYNNTELLIKAFDAGEISLLNYMVEIGLYYTVVNQALTAERDYQKAFADLSSVAL